MWETVDSVWLIITPVKFYEATRGRLSAKFAPAPAQGRGIITHVSRVSHVSRATAYTWRQATTVSTVGLYKPSRPNTDCSLNCGLAMEWWWVLVVVSEDGEFLQLCSCFLLHKG